MANFKLVALFALLIFISLPPTLLACKGLKKPNAIISNKTLSKLFKIVGKVFGRFNKLKEIYDLIQLLENISSPTKPHDNAPDTNEEADSIGFYVNFSAGGDPEMIARMSISSSITYLENYNPSMFSSCCDKNLTCYDCNYVNNSYNAASDTFYFGSGFLMNVIYMYDPVGNQQKYATSVLSLSRSPYSLLNSVRNQYFTYNISESRSHFWIGFEPDTTELESYESTDILTNLDHPYLYYVSLTQISIENTAYKIDPRTKSSSAFLDTLVTATLLERSVYAKVKTEIMKLGSSFSDPDHGLELCFSDKPNWPNVTFFFPSDSSAGSAQMVLTKNNYVVTVEKTKAQCAAIFETEGASVIGIMAQLNRDMVFNLTNPDQPILYFTKYSSFLSSGSSVVSSMIMVLLWSLCVLLYLYVPV